MRDQLLSIRMYVVCPVFVNARAHFCPLSLSFSSSFPLCQSQIRSCRQTTPVLMAHAKYVCINWLDAVCNHSTIRELCLLLNIKVTNIFQCTVSSSRRNFQVQSFSFKRFNLGKNCTHRFEHSSGPTLTALSRMPVTADRWTLNGNTSTRRPKTHRIKSIASWSIALSLSIPFLCSPVPPSLFIYLSLSLFGWLINVWCEFLFFFVFASCLYICVPVAALSAPVLFCHLDSEVSKYQPTIQPLTSFIRIPCARQPPPNDPPRSHSRNAPIFAIK